VEATIDVHLGTLAEALGVPEAGITESEGRALDDRLGKAGPV
jgi:hypothetical protein